MKQLTIISELVKVWGYCFVKFSSFSDKHFLHTEEIPVFPDRLKEIVKEVIEFNTKIIPDEYDMISQLDLIDGNAFRNLLSYLILPIADFSQSLLYLWLKRLWKIKVFEWVKRHYWVKQMSGF